MRGVIATGDADPRILVEKARAVSPMEGADLVRGVTCESAFDWTPVVSDEFTPLAERQPKRALRIAAYDFGMKWNILRRFTAYGCDVRVYPATAPASQLLASNPDGVFLSNGPGDPAALGYAVENARELVQSEVPVFGICLGHQLLSLALGGSTYKLKFGHRGANHPVKELETGKVEITSQNHGFAVDPESLPKDVSHARQSVQRHGRGTPARNEAGLLRAVSPRGGTRPARRGLPVPAISRRHGRTGLTSSVRGFRLRVLRHGRPI